MMTLETHTLELVMSELIKDYLAATQTGQADAAVPKEMMDGLKEPERPVIVVTAKEEGSKDSARRVVKINPVLCTWMKSEKTEAVDVEQQTTREEASRLMAAIDHRLRDEPALSSWFKTIDPSRLAGWTIMKIVHEGHAPPMRPNESRSMMFSLSIRLHLFVANWVPV